MGFLYTLAVPLVNGGHPLDMLEDRAAVKKRPFSLAAKLHFRLLVCGNIDVGVVEKSQRSGLEAHGRGKPLVCEELRGGHPCSAATVQSH